MGLGGLEGGDGGGLPAFQEGTGLDGAGFRDDEGLVIDRALEGGLAAVQGVVDGGAFRPAAQRDGGLIPEQGEVFLDGGGGDQFAPGHGVRGLQMVAAVVGGGRCLETKFAAFHDLAVAEEVPFHRCSVQGDAGDIRVLGVVRCDGEGFSVAQAEGGLAEERYRENVLAAAGTGRIHAQGRQDIPGAHLAAVLVAADAFRRGVVQGGEEFPHDFLGAGGGFQPGEDISHVMAGFVAVGILAQVTGNVGNVDALAALLIGEQGIQGCQHGFASAHQGCVSGLVLRDEETGLPGNGLGIVAGAGDGVEGTYPGAVAVPSAHEAGIGIENVAVIAGAPVIGLGDVPVAQGFGHAGDAPVVIGEFQRLRDRLLDAVGRDVAVLRVQVRYVGPFVAVAGGDHGLEGFLSVETADAAEPGVGYDGNAVVADHGLGFPVAEGPDGKFSGAVEHVQHAHHHVSHQGGIDQGLEGIPTSERVPEGQGGIEVGSVLDGSVAVHVVPVQAADVVHAVGHLERMVQAGIELPGGAAFHADAAQGLFPHGRGQGTDAAEAGFRRLCQPVGAGSFHAGAGKPRIDHEFAHVFGEGEEQFPFPAFFGFFERDGEGGRQVDVAAFRPADDVAVAVHFPVTGGFQAAGFGLGAFADAVDGIQEQQPFALPRERVAVDAYARGGREFHGDALRKIDLIVSGDGRFFLVVQGKGLHAVQTRGEKEISEVCAAGTGKVRMAEAQDE